MKMGEWKKKKKGREEEKIKHQTDIWGEAEEDTDLPPLPCPPTPP